LSNNEQYVHRSHHQRGTLLSTLFLNEENTTGQEDHTGQEEDHTEQEEHGNNTRVINTGITPGDQPQGITHPGITHPENNQQGDTYPENNQQEIPTMGLTGITHHGLTGITHHGIKQE